MSLTRYQIRNEYGLADKELYQATDKDDPEALFDAAPIAGLVGILRQLGDLAEFAAEVFNCVHEEVMKTAARGHGLGMRIQHLELGFLSIEIPILSQTQQSTFFYHPGLEWHSNLPTEENMIASRKLPPCIMDSYEESRGPPQLFLLDKFDVVGSGSCLKRYSDPTLFKTKLNKDESETPRKPKKKESHTTRAETPEDSKTSHTKLHQLFMLEHVEKGHRNLEFHVKLKRRQLNRPPINSSSRTGYMENFLKNSSPHCDAQVEDLPIPSLVYPNYTDTRKQTEMKMEIEIESIVNYESLETPVVPEEDSGVSMEIQSTKENVISLETESEISLTGLVEDQFSSITNQEIDVSVAADAEDNVILKANETNSNDGPCMNIEQSGCIPNLEITSENKNPSSLCWQDELSDEQEEDPQSMDIVSDDINENEVPPILDTQRHGVCFGGLKDKCSENVSEYISHQECPITTSAEPLPCLVSTQDHVQEHCFALPNETPHTVPEITPPLLPLPPIQWWNEPSRATEETSPTAVNGTSNTSNNPNPQGLNTNWRSEAMALEWFSQNLLEHNNKPEHEHPLGSPRETEYPQNSNDVNGKAGKVPRDKDPLVIGIDKSMLRKVSERNKTQVRARVDDNDSLLEIIRSKSFNLRRADASVRPNFQVAVPMTNLKVAAILERANTLRQAVAGSDEEHDSDSWSE